MKEKEPMCMGSGQSNAGIVRGGVSGLERKP